MIKPIAILGGTGFVGRHLANRLTKVRYPLKVLTRRRERHRELLVPHWFDQTLPGVDFPIALLFLDVDLEASLDTCVRNLWPYPIDGGCLFTDDRTSTTSRFSGRNAGGARPSQRRRPA
jgi:hypothetical protein